MSDTAIDAIGGNRPLTTEEFARRAHDYTLNPSHNRLKEILDRYNTVEETPPLLGIFNDIPWYQFRESEAHSWAMTLNTDSGKVGTAPNRTRPNAASDCSQCSACIAKPTAPTETHSSWEHERR